MAGETARTRRAPLAVAIVDGIAADILAGSLAAGSLVPPEPQLTERFGVSRTVVREAMARLQKMGLVRIRQGAGTVVLAAGEWREFDPDLVRIRAETRQIADLLPDLLAVRRLIEVEVAGYVAIHRTPEQLARLSDLVARMRAAGSDAVAQTELDLRFHESLLAARGNRLLREMMTPVNHLRRIGSLMTTSASERVIALSIDGHAAILNAIRAGDEPGARAEMTAHLVQFERDLEEAMATPAPPPNLANL